MPYNAAYQDDRKRLTDLVERLGRQRNCASRCFANRVACPARGTLLASGRIDRWLSVLDYLVDATMATDCLAKDSISCWRWSRSAPTCAPCPASKDMPGSALTRLLNGTPELVSSADLSVIAGDIEAGDGLWNTESPRHRWFYPQ
ncbi:MAG: hypothetical protein IPJ50_16485 [Betaproteobacteria bacterium]|nr:hypothetical protein [Betaproteobacteria bacterium]